MLVPSSSNELDALNEGLADLWLCCKLCDGHFCDVGGNTYEVVKSGHDGVDGAIDEYARRAAIDRGDGDGKYIGEAAVSCGRGEGRSGSGSGA